MPLSPIELAVVLVAVGTGATVQGSVGFGFALVAAPVLALLEPRALPVTLLFLALPMTSLMALRERRAIDVPGFWWITGGRVLGTAAGVFLLVLVPGDSLSTLFGTLILLAAVTSALGPEIELRRRVRLLAGIASGVMGTAAAVGGPPLALVYRDRPGPELRSTLAISFATGVVLSLIALALARRIAGWHLVLALELLPALLLGLWASRFTVRLLDARWLRPAVLLFAAAAGVAAVVEGVAG